MELVNAPRWISVETRCSLIIVQPAVRRPDWTESFWINLVSKREILLSLQCEKYSSSPHAVTGIAIPLGK
jgi:hypothetical protein